MVLVVAIFVVVVAGGLGAGQLASLALEGSHRRLFLSFVVLIFVAMAVVVPSLMLLLVTSS